MDKVENELYKKSNYKEMSKLNIYNTLELLLNEGVEFNVIIYTNFIDFNPEIPKDIIEFNDITVFTIAGYSYESALVSKDTFSFEAGFGLENYGSILNIPLEAIIQIRLDEDVLLINYYEPIKEQKTLNSMDILLNNPENKKLLNKKNINK